MASATGIDERRRSGAVLFSLMLITTAISLSAPAVSAVGPNQNDLGFGTDLPDNSSSVNSTNAILNMSGLAPFATAGNLSGELDVGDDEDWFAMTLNANEGVTLQIAYNTSFTSANGSTYFNDFELWMYDSSLNIIEYSINNNPEIVSTNSSQSPHGGTVYFKILRYNGYGSYDLDFWLFSTSSSNGTGGNGTTTPSNCAGSATLTSDILEPNDAITTASVAALPLMCTGLSIHTASDYDYFEVVMITGVTYYANITFIGSNGDLDTGWSSATGSYLSGSGSTGSLESMTVYSSTNQTTYLSVYGYAGDTNVYDISITTDLPGGGQSFESVDVTINNFTSAMVEFSGLTVGQNYAYNYSTAQETLDANMTWSNSTTGIFNATTPNMMFNITVAAPDMIESNFYVVSTLMDSNLSFIAQGFEIEYIEVLETTVSSSTSGEIRLTNLTTGTDYMLEWVVIDAVAFDNALNTTTDLNAVINASQIDRNFTSWIASSTAQNLQLSWNGPTTLNQHFLVGILSINNTYQNLSTGEGWVGFNQSFFIPQLPTLLIDSYSMSSISTTNDVMTKGYDLVIGDQYQYQIRVTDSNGASFAASNLNSFNATATNQSMPLFTYATPNASAIYCIYSDLYSGAGVQLIGDSDCFMLSFDDDGDGVVNEYDLCSNTTAGASVDFDGCELSQKDSDSDGYNDLVDVFPYDSSQYSDIDGDGYGDNPNGNSPDAFPLDGSQWDDQDGDGYGDNPNGNYSDMFPFDATQWDDQDGDGYGDNPNGNYPDEYPIDSTQWTDSDGDGYGDNPTGTSGDAFPNDPTEWLDSDADGCGDNSDLFVFDSTQCTDSDGDGYGDNPTGTDGDAFIDDPSQWSDQDKDGYGDNQAGNQPDLFPSDGTQWSDNDGDGYGDNPNGNAADRFVDDSTQWFDDDNDGFGDNANGNNPDYCLGTPAGAAVDAVGCAASQLDDDLDGITNNNDACPNTPAGQSVDATGCAGSQEDSDNDGVMDAFDLCPSTALGQSVDNAGCADEQLDTDNDGIYNDVDQCPITSPGAMVNGVGCSSSERDTDGDSVMDISDLCSMTPVDEEVDADGCSNSQRDDDNDLFTNDIDACPNTELGLQVDTVGCAAEQYDDDEDLIDNTIDQCPATPTGEQVDSQGCADSQLDQDNDSISDDLDLCPDTDESRNVDINGCSEHQKDDDADSVTNNEDDCPFTPEGAILIENGCALTQLDSDNDGVNDAEDDFPMDQNETTDTDGDGVSDTFDAYPEDAFRSEREAEGGSGTLIFGLLALLVFSGLAALLMVRNKQEDDVTSQWDVQNSTDPSTEAHMNQQSKELPSIESESQQWEENGITWSKAGDGSLSYYDESSALWILYEQ